MTTLTVRFVWLATVLTTINAFGHGDSKTKIFNDTTISQDIA